MTNLVVWCEASMVAGAEEYISRFDKEQLEKNEEVSAMMAKKIKDARDAESAVALKREADMEEERKQQQARTLHKKCKRTSPWWAFFKEGVANTTHVYCTLPSKDDPEKECGGAIAKSACPSGLNSHCLYMHNDVWKEVDAKIRQDKEEKVDPGEVARGNNQSNTLTGKEGSVWSESRKKDIDEKFAYWVAKNKRPVSLLEDDEFRLTLKDATRGAYHNSLKSIWN
ncbi:hypothetical protein CYMTET_31035 [Cymbomonas tetramitiformis]|uniref:Uncharacterized protein n=1 Tax=Cymbomonas tetramitiformis TaxID=36881 RepID=A0AAE0FI68_9CHLO|nr:hypothetical protein CYMTET_31035 [Cymbomonas tetramitiformis]